MPDKGLDRMKKFMEADFLPAHDRAIPNSEYRVATALEYIAYHMGQIDKKLDDTNALLAGIANQMP